MSTEPSTLLVTMEADPESREIIAGVIEPSAQVIYLDDVQDAEREMLLGEATALLSRNTAKELREGEAELLQNARLVQYVSAGVDLLIITKRRHPDPDKYPEYTKNDARARGRRLSRVL